MVFHIYFWKDKDLYSWQGWYNTLKGFDGLIWTRNTKASYSPLHTEMDNKMYEKTMTLQKIVLIDEDGFKTKRIAYFCNIYRKFEIALLPFNSSMYPDLIIKGYTFFHLMHEVNLLILSI